MDTNDTSDRNAEILFTPRRTIRKNHNGELGMDETFYMNNDFSGSAKSDILHCLACGVSRWGGDWCIEKEYRDYISFNLFLEGSVFIQTQDGTRKVNAGDLLIARRKSLLMRTPSGGMAKKYCLLLSNTLIQSTICDFIAPDDPGVLSVNDPAAVAKAMEAIIEYVKNGSSRRQLNLLIFDFLQEVREQQQQRNFLPPLLEKALGILRQSEFKISRFELAQACNISPRTLTRLFDHYLHTPPGQYIIRCRMEKAARMLTIGNEPVKTVAGECGFSSPMFFAREFRKYYHCPPSKYRKQK